MIYTEMVKTAMKIAFDAHKDQLDKAGVPYIYHTIHLAEHMDNELAICVALLHDVVEDTDLDFTDLSHKGISDSIIEILKLLTHTFGMPYMEYIQNIKNSKNPVAIAVKLEDLRHNSNTSRLDMLDDKSIERNKKYNKAIELLS